MSVGLAHNRLLGARTSCLVPAGDGQSAIGRLWLLLASISHRTKPMQIWPPWPNGQGVGLLIRRLRARVPQGVLSLGGIASELPSETIFGQPAPANPAPPNPHRRTTRVQHTIPHNAKTNAQQTKLRMRKSGAKTHLRKLDWYNVAASHAKVRNEIVTGLIAHLSKAHD